MTFSFVLCIRVICKLHQVNFLPIRAYRLEASNDYIKWETLYEHRDGDLFDTDIVRREHEITREPKPFKKYKFFVTETGWMRNSVKQGYVVVRDFLLC